jgi:hypothetical protein
MQTEQELIRLCARPDLSTGQIERIGQLLVKGVDWPLLLSIALSHRVFTFLFGNLARFFQDSIPADISGEWKRIFLEISARNLFLSHQLLNLLDLFSKNSIEAIPFKGPVLSEYLFGDINRRIYGDLDILIAKSDLDTAVRLLRNEGFQFDIDLGLDQYLKLARQGAHAAMIMKKKPCMVELHWELTGRCFSRDVELRDLRTRAREIRFMGRQVLTLSPEDLLVHLCIHGNRHYWRQLDSISCVAGLISLEKGLVWELALDIAERFGARRMLLLGCLLAHEVLDVRLNSCISEKISKEPGVKDVAGEVGNKLFSGFHETSPSLAYRDKLKYHWKTLDNFTDWFHGSMKPLFRPTHSDWVWFPLPAPISGLYYILRPVRLGMKYARKLRR